VEEEAGEVPEEEAEAGGEAEGKGREGGGRPGKQRPPAVPPLRLLTERATRQRRGGRPRREAADQLGPGLLDPHSLHGLHGLHGPHGLHGLHDLEIGAPRSQGGGR
jgi:hypothetical protein